MQGCLSVIDFLDKHASLCVALVSVISMFVSAGIAIVVALVLRKSEELRSRSQIAVQIGIEAAKRSFELGKIAMDRGAKATFIPTEVWILSAIKLAELLMIKKIDTKTAKIKLEENIKFSKEMLKTIEQNQ
ncbi:MAG: hypothetical protein WC381_10660 [Kiritimatiellia bacterium]|jgi:hypothetical protein